MPGLPITWTLALALLAGLAALPRGAGVGRLVWRTRWLFLVLILGYAYSLPGAALWPALDTWSPSLEGAQHGAAQALRLLALLLWLDLLVLRLPPDRLLGGVYALLAPLARLGVPAGRVALRLGLTLQAIERMERGRPLLRGLLDETAVPNVPENLRIECVPARLGDVLIPLGCAAVLSWPWFSA